MVLLRRYSCVCVRVPVCVFMAFPLVRVMCSTVRMTPATVHLNDCHVTYMQGGRNHESSVCLCNRMLQCGSYIMNCFSCYGVLITMLRCKPAFVNYMAMFVCNNTTTWCESDVDILLFLVCLASTVLCHTCNTLFMEFACVRVVW